MKQLSVLVSTLGFLILLTTAQPARALFHFAVIDEVMTSYAGDATVQFVEIQMLAGSQNFVTNSVLGAFDATGSYLGDVLVVPGDVTNSGAGVRWIMGTAQFQVVSGLTPDFTMPAGLPTGGGMVCWGAPGILPPLPGSWDHTNPANYVDCLAYGSYSGPSNIFVGTPTPITGDGHSVSRISDTEDNAFDFVCEDPATPTNNAGSTSTFSLVATTLCPADIRVVASVDFGTVPVGNLGNQNLSIENVGDATLTVTGITSSNVPVFLPKNGMVVVAGGLLLLLLGVRRRRLRSRWLDGLVLAGLLAAFAVSQASDAARRRSLNIQIGPDQTATLPIDFTPLAVVPYSETLTIVSSDPDENIVMVDLVGEGTP